jgi:hypothetical protein
MIKAFAIFGITFLLAINTFGKDLLKPLKWNHRPLLIFSPSKDKHLEKQLLEIDQNQKGIIERDMKIFILHSNLTGTMDDNAIDSVQVADLYKKFDVSPEQFSILLIGKDGGVKMRKTQSMKIKDIFAIIDKMPMRQREMQK